jgi:putative transport protein
MDWLKALFFTDGIAHTILLLSMVIAFGTVCGKIKVFGISLGPTFVLFAGLLVGHFGFTVNHQVADFIREFGLILFIYSIGLQVGPSFFTSFKKGGMQLNLMAAGVVTLGALTTIGLWALLGGRVSMPMMVGIMSGAVTNTPGLGAAQEALRQVHDAGRISEIPPIALGYAIAYPLAVVGIILSMVTLRKVFSVRMEEEEKKLEKEAEASLIKPVILTLKLSNKAISGKPLHEIKQLVGREFVITRLCRDHRYSIPQNDTVLMEGDLLLVVVGACDEEPIKAFVGVAIEMDWKESDKILVSRRIVITQSSINGKTLGSMRVRTLYGVSVTRVHRAGLDLLATPNLVLQVGDRVVVVGELEAIEKLEAFLGNTLKRLNEPHIITLFVGIFLGILLGSVPLYIPGIPMPVKLGLAGGPLVISILIGRFGYKLKLITYTTQSANLLLREVGISLFLAVVGILAGGSFAQTVFSKEGAIWIGTGLLITVIPLLIMGSVGRKVAGLNYFTLIGMMAGSTTDPPALSYAGSISNNDQPAVSYSTVYPLTMFLRVIFAQLLILIFV